MSDGCACHHYTCMECEQRGVGYVPRAELDKVRAAAFADAAAECERQAGRFDGACKGAMSHVATYIRTAHRSEGVYDVLRERDALAAEVARLREALRKVLGEVEYGSYARAIEAARTALAALADGKEGG